MENKFIYPFINSSCRYLAFDDLEPTDVLILSSMRKIVDCYESPDAVKEFHICSLLLEIFASVIKKSCTKVFPIKNSVNFVFAQQLINYLRKNISEEIFLENIENELGVSKDEICRKFKKAINLSVFQYLKQTRIEKATKLLSVDNKTIERVAIECGFHSTSHFCTTFKEATGISPLKYRNGRLSGFDIQ